MGLTTLHPGQPCRRKLTHPHSEPGFWPGRRSRRRMEARTGACVKWRLRRRRGQGTGAAGVEGSGFWKPHRMERYLASKDPEFEQKAAAIIGLYLNPPQHAAVFCVDEKTAIQALDRKGPAAAVIAGTRRTARVRVLSPWHAVIVRRTQSADRQCHGPDAARHTSTEFVKFAGRGRVQLPGRSAGAYHSRQPERSQGSPGARVSRRASERGVSLHADLISIVARNQVEIWFSKLQREVIDRGIFTSVADLRHKVLRYIRLYGKSAKPFRWKYSNVRHRIPA